MIYIAEAGSGRSRNVDSVVLRAKVRFRGVMMPAWIFPCGRRVFYLVCRVAKEEDVYISVVCVACVGERRVRLGII